jgi:hypothetical protein
MVLDEISMVGNIILKFVDQTLRSVKYMHTNYFGNKTYLNIIITGDFYQAQPIMNTPVYKPNNNNINFFRLDF